MADVTKEQVVEYLSNLSVIELAGLVEELEDEWGVEAAAAVAAAPAAGAGGGEEAEEQTEFDVVLTSFGDKKIQVIKVVRNITNMGLKDAKELVENAPTAIKEGVDKEEAEKIQGEIEEVGGSVELK